MASISQKITPFIWFNDNAEEAANFYVSVFKNSKIVHISRYPEAGQEVHGHKAGSAMVVEFTLEGLNIQGINGGPQFPQTEAFSLMISCDTQEEIDYYWDKLTADGGEESMCGWLKDKFGLSWQVTPSMMYEFYDTPDKERSARTMNAMMQMKKLDIAKLKKAYDGK